MKLKRLVSVTLAFNLIFMLFSCLSALNLSAEDETVTIAYIEGSNVNVRSGPSTKHSKVDTVSYITATVIGKSQSGEDVWYKITYKNDENVDIEGYIYYDSDYIRIVTYNPNPEPDVDFETKISAFPESYREALRELHAIYPNWEFIPDPISTKFSSAVNSQTTGFRKLVNSSQNISWRSMSDDDYYDWNKKTWGSTEGGWYAASYEVISYYMDPRNFLDNNYVYMFLDQSYNPTYQNEEGLMTIVEGTFLANTYSDPDDTEYDGSYIKVIMEAAEQSGVSPYIIAAKIIQEIGSKGTSSMVSGTTEHGKYYNFFNWGATGSTDAVIIKNGLDTAKKYGWNTRSKAIIGGAKQLSSNYIATGQNTYYYQNFNVKNPDKLYHQYAQAIHDSASKASISGDDYKTKYNAALSFYIPVYTNMPSTPCEKPKQSTKLNNYYILNVQADSGSITPTFDKYKNEYAFENTDKKAELCFNIEIPVGATFTSEKSYSLQQGTSELKFTVKSQTGYTRNYVFSVYSDIPATLKLNIYDAENPLPDPEAPSNPDTEPEPEPEPKPEPTPTYKLGDVNNDGKVSISDLGAIKINLLGEYTFSETEKLAADINKDGKISISDLGAIKLHLLGDYTIEGW